MGQDGQQLLPGVKLVLFDLDGTLRRRSPTFHEALLAFAQDIGYSFAPKAQRAAMKWAHAYRADPARSDEVYRAGDEASRAGYVGGYLAAMGLANDEAGRLAAIMGPRFAHDYAPETMLARGAKQVLWELRERNLRIGLVSNSPVPLTGTAIELGIIEHMDFTLASGQIGICKPDPELLKQALTLAGGIQPEETVHVGDNYFTDIIGAQRAGIHAVLLDEHDVYEQSANGCLIIRRLDELLGLLPP